MSDFLSNEQTKAQVAPKQLLKRNEKYGSSRVLKFSLDTTVTPIANGDRFFIGYLPRYSRVTGGQVTFGAMGASATLSIGTDATTYATTQPEQGAGTGTEFLNALDVSAASSTKKPLCNVDPTVVAAVAPDTSGVSSGYGYENKLGQVAIYATAGGANYASGKHIEGTIEFSSEIGD